MQGGLAEQPLAHRQGGVLRVGGGATAAGRVVAEHHRRLPEAAHDGAVGLREGVLVEQHGRRRRTRRSAASGRKPVVGATRSVGFWTPYDASAVRLCAAARR